MVKKMLCGICVVMLASVAVARETKVVRTSHQSSASLAPALLGQADIPMPSPISPVPDPVYSQVPLNSYPSSPSYAPAYPVQSQPLPIYQNVKYRGQRNIAPCAVPTIIQVPDPCNKDACCKTCVNVEVCVPPCDPKNIRVTRDGDRVRYDYGKYAVVVKSVRGHVVVHYED